MGIISQAIAAKKFAHLTALTRAVTNDESNMLSDTGLDKNVIDAVKTRGVAISKEEAVAQFENYLKTIPQDRKPIILGHLKEAQQTSKDEGRDLFSAAGAQLATAKDTNVEEKIMGFDLYMAQLNDMDKKANAGK